MPTTRIKDLSTTTTSAASDDYVALDGLTNGTRKMLGSKLVAAVASTTDNALARYDGTAGQVQNSAATLDDSGNLAVTGTLSAANTFTLASAGNANEVLTSSSATNAAYLSIGNTGASGTSFDVGVGGASHALTGIRNKLYAYGGSAILETLDTSGNKSITGNLTVSGTGPHTLAGPVVSTGSTSAVGANKAVLDYTAGTTTRLVSYGPDASTPGAFQIVGLSSNASAGDIRVSISDAGNTTLAGNLTVSGTQNKFGVPASADALSTNSTMTFELTSNTQLKIKVRGSDGTTREVALTLA